ncbi:M48 metallopeptidase family protein [Actinophytocola algeriensis]|uniref:YgjP-like metallopeptidase domain-containing protein n=1 Tax=Actinophytocola algeriensis TaxID=1768010 RepID=A0A7W7VHT2_9PSEU|nr:M48 family metallopeptidase [Actinophytocola algeriensis]MBB4910544.1 hypothetical protein [Actinophytocola algeriensis]MBE1480467.1 hypothetical protein [Actinophytocola algeriensis]
MQVDQVVLGRGVIAAVVVRSNVVHELVHFHERGYGPRFVELMDHYLPDWRSRRDELNDAPRAAEEWSD